LIGAGGIKYIVWGNPDIIHPTGVWKVIITLFVSPVVGFVFGAFVLLLLTLLFLRATMRISNLLRFLQAGGTAVLAFAHGANDPQKSMGIIMLALHAAGFHFAEGIPVYVRIAAGIAIVLGVVSLAPSIVKRVSHIYRLRTLHGLSAEMASGAVVLFGSLTGGPVAASQVISSSVMGVGSAARRKGVHWLIAKDMLLAWFLTIPCSALLACVIHTFIVQWVSYWL
jgi:PiT family inorganic phosphate transporter